MAQRRESHAQENPVTAIDIALEPDATMVEHAHADNGRRRKAFPKGFALDATHHPHLSHPLIFRRSQFATSDTYLDPEILALRVLRHRILRHDHR